MTSQWMHFVRRRCAVVGLVAFVGLSAAGCDHRAQPIANPVPIAAASPPEQKALEAAIETALANRKWTIKEHTPGRYTAAYAERSFSATVAVLYDGQGARVEYVDSQNLLYEKSGEGAVIHRSYNTWVKNLANDIKVNLSQANLSVASTPPAAK
jgi:hypothetical protein